MLTFTDTAKERVARFLALQQAQGVRALRVAGDRREQKLWLVKPEDRRPDDHTFRVAGDEGFDVFVDPRSAEQLAGATVDFVEDVMQSGFRVFYPSPTWDDPVAQRVQEVLDRIINPGVASHGGHVSLAKVEGDAAYVLLGGGCQGCGAADITLRQGIEEAICSAVPEIKRVLDATDHASGTNPYYAPAESGDSPLARS
ncbi:NifU family protein [Truepera radiovictrix]|uniref:Nitrogen-fixing NifU domain protein n=1 Tax=Truepera radiovictrix (strain DSM 17093 / CIP 108686 / LMG 22925 / RQ-24) TaxID=649638 RepID=D7CUE2_TRURR|nr:NifU family protein [Truepera radiovictrix]ADI15727.1 nitrogen-fixing NifU domain protein [Truepera radiovictrix DSM 17093]WMT58647.1 NifU family protein [Truepera radiovictrix]